MYNPVSTYRLQFHKQFGFNKAVKLVSYFDKLGVGTIYASPVLEAVEESMHGYDGIDPQNINPEIGTRNDLERLSEKLKQKHIGWLQDIVPNHLAFDPRNPWLADVLEKGIQSPYSGHFDIRWSDGEPLMAPFLGTDRDSAVKEGVIQLIFTKGRFYFHVYDQNYPLNPGSYRKILQALPAASRPELQALIDGIPELTGNEKDAGSWEKYTEKLSGAASAPSISEHINSCLEKINISKECLSELLNDQFYQLCHSQRTHEKINYRRFFTVNGLICLNIQNKNVFDDYHAAILKMLRSGVFQGLRIDHIDGLYDPPEYLQRLRRSAGKGTYIVVEKILEYDEVIPDNWPVQGATGYSFLAAVNNLLTYTPSEKQFTDYYKSISRDKRPIAQQITSRKTFILYHRMAGELENLFRDLKPALEALDIEVSQVDAPKIREAIGAFLVEFPVYRFYGRQMPPPPDEAAAVEAILDGIIDTRAGLKKATLLLKELLLEKTKKANPDFNERMLHFYHRMMQISGPLMAKGVEDTLMYSYNRFIGHNEVGNSLEVFGIDVSEWHDKMRMRMNRHPLTMNTISTHDTKRGEDVRARLNVLTEIPEVWFAHVDAFREMNRTLKTHNCPDKNDEYFIYLTLLGMYSMPGEADEDIGGRLKEYIPKALREAKLNSNWTDPEEYYEEKVTDFALSLLNKNKPFWKEFSDLHAKISDFGIMNSIAQLILKCASPGLPDIYRGTELWDLSLVDPDNRRPVDYGLRMRWLDELEQLAVEAPDKLWKLLWEERYNGKIKLWLTKVLLNYRRTHPELFMSGAYLPLTVRGKYKNHLLAFARQYEKKWLLVGVPLFMAKLCNTDRNRILDHDWATTEIVLPDHAPRRWKSILQPDETPDIQGTVGLNKIDAYLPPVLIYENVD